MKKNLATFVYAILAGICIGLGGTVFLRVKDAFPGANIVGAILVRHRPVCHLHPGL